MKNGISYDAQRNTRRLTEFTKEEEEESDLEE